jgi:hypothetical protein
MHMRSPSQALSSTNSSSTLSQIDSVDAPTRVIMYQLTMALGFRGRVSVILLTTIVVDSLYQDISQIPVTTLRALKSLATTGSRNPGAWPYRPVVTSPC